MPQQFHINNNCFIGDQDQGPVRGNEKLGTFIGKGKIR
jgi:hypothetical protein